MKRLVAIVTVILLQGSLFAATQTQDPKKACCDTRQCISDSVSCCERTPSQPAPTPVTSTNIQGFKDFYPIISMEFPAPRVLLTSLSHDLLSSAPTRGSPLYQLKSSFLI